MAEELLKKEETDEAEGLLEEDDSQKGMFMTFQIGKEFFGISISYVNEIIAMQPIAAIPEVDDYIKGLINLRLMFASDLRWIRANIRTGRVLSLLM